MKIGEGEAGINKIKVVRGGSSRNKLVRNIYIYIYIYIYIHRERERERGGDL